MPLERCPRCGAVIVRDVGLYIYLTYPAQYDLTMWCGCGYREPRGRVFDERPHERLQRKWEEINAQ